MGTGYSDSIHNVKLKFTIGKSSVMNLKAKWWSRFASELKILS